MHEQGALVLDVIEAKKWPVSIIGSGVVGRGWIPVFLRAGCTVRVYDFQHEQMDVAKIWVRNFLKNDAACARVTYHRDLDAALEGAAYVQESIAEKLKAKQVLFADLSKRVLDHSILASSTSSLDINEIARDAHLPQRCYTVHPFNPAAVLPAVEVLGTRGAPKQLTGDLTKFLESLGQVPIVLKKFVPGYIGNRLQAAVMRESLNLVASGVTDVDGIDAIMREGLALRWSLLGVIGTNYTNDDGGLRGYYGKFLDSYRLLAKTLSPDIPLLTEEQISTMTAELERRFGGASVAEVSHWRDSQVAALRELTDRVWDPAPSSSAPSPAPLLDSVLPES